VRLDSIKVFAQRETSVILGDTVILIAPLLALLVAHPVSAAPDALQQNSRSLKPLKIYILAGQSNMQGHASIDTFDSMAGDPKTAPLLKEMLDREGKPKVCERVWITSVGCQGDAYTDLTEAKGKLTAGFGAPNNKIGPEFTFGLTMESRLKEPVLLIKTSWGGRSLHTDFRPPSAGPFVMAKETQDLWDKNPQGAHGIPKAEDRPKFWAEKTAATGVYYREMIAHVRRVLKDIKRVVPSYDEKQGYELAGFVWFQGFNDLVGFSEYPNRDSEGGFDAYADVLGHFVRDVRKDLAAPKLPFVIGVMGIDGVKGEHGAMKHFRDAQRKVAAIDKFKGNVLAVETAPFWDDDLDSLAQRRERLSNKLEDEFNKANPKPSEPEKEVARKKAFDAAFKPEEFKRLEAGVSNGGYHYLGAAKIMAPIGKALAEALLPKSQEKKPPVAGEMAGYLLVPHGGADKSYNAGFSMYVAAWPLLKNYPGQDFQSGLFGTWMFAQYEGLKAPEKAYSDIEGGLGWWRDTRFATETPKFIMGGVAREFVEWANGPGAGKGRDWDNPAGHYAIAQLSPWVLWPPDGLNLKQGTNGELFGYGYLPLPLTSAKKITAGKPVPTGDQCWTLFLNTGNFKGPVTTFLPYFWSKPTIDKPELAAMFLDARPSDPNRAIQMETQHIPAYIGIDANGVSYARVAPTRFPSSPSGQSPLIHKVTSYKRAALWDSVQAWFAGGKEAPGRIDPNESTSYKFPSDGGATWQIYTPNTAGDARALLAWSSFAKPIALDPWTYGYQWPGAGVTKSADLATLPEFYRLEKQGAGKGQWVVVKGEDVPPETGLADVQFPRRRGTEPDPYVTPNQAASSWNKPGPVAGPFQAKLGDGSVVTYSWYRFADQPAMLNADLSTAEREAMQKRVEMIHRKWKKDREYLPPPAVGKLAQLDPGVIVTPPKGFEIGYVPIVTRQERRRG
jgi:hypothetical protein